MIVAEGLRGQHPIHLVAAPEVGSVYAIMAEGSGPALSWPLLRHPRLQRLDETPLAVQQERRWEGTWQMVWQHLAP